MILYTLEEITTAHRYLKTYIDNLKRHLFNQWFLFYFISFIVNGLICCQRAVRKKKDSRTETIV